MPGPCSGACQLYEDTMRVSKLTGHLPRCVECGYAHSTDEGQLRCKCCKAQLRRARR